ncbi:MAG: hypothetical protein FWC23_08065 [Chitinispirillia bacterium]|nr:hypothetical protein [Chitinispirillia bacterium]MCL2269127.1 hypothetical protein [Chitinispirillia bacterium]
MGKKKAKKRAAAAAAAAADNPQPAAVKPYTVPLRTQLFWMALALAITIVPAKIYHNHRDNVLKENALYTNAVIYKLLNHQKRGYPLICYHYTVADGFEYVEHKKQGKRHRRRPCCTSYRLLIADCPHNYTGAGRWYPKYDTLSVGDSIAIIYNKKKPSHSRTKRDLKIP